jgi:short-subunit dehydrogenase
MSKVLSGKTALVTGASRGIGAATAEALAAAGAHIILTARKSKGLEAVEERIHQAGGTATIAPMDLIDGDSIGRLAAALTERFKALDILVLNAAMLGTLTPVQTIDPKEFANLIMLNLTAQQALIAAFNPMLRSAEAGQVIGMTSSVGQTPRAYWGAYGASKAGFETLLGAYSEEYRNIGRVKVAIIDPGATATQMRAQAFPGEDAATLKSAAVVGARIAALVSEGFENGHRERID